MDRLRVGQGDGGGFSIAEPMAKRLKENLKALEQAISDRTEIRDSLDARLAAALRAFFPEDRAGGLVVRAKWVDVSLLVLAGLVVAVSAFTLDLRDLR